MSLAALAPIGVGLLGALAGSQGDKSTQNYAKQVAPASALEDQATKSIGGSLTGLEALINAGPGQQAMTDSLGSQNALAALLQQFAQGGFMPGQQDINQANQFAQQMFAPQQTALAQRFQDAQMMGNRQAARMGRAGNDPILLNKMLQEQTRQQAMLDSERGAFGAQFAQQMPMQRLNFQSQLAQVRGGLASQALANRQALLNAGSQLKQQEQNFRSGTASTSVTSSSGGGLAGGITGALAGIGSGMDIYSKFAGMPKTTPAPAAGGGLAVGAPTTAYNGMFTS